MAVADYLRGTGTEADPYVIHNLAAWDAFLSNTTPCFTTSATFEVVSDIDCGGKTYPSRNVQVNATLKGNGHTISNFTCAGSLWYCASGSYSGRLINIHLSARWGTYGAFGSNNSGGFREITNVKLTVVSGTPFQYSDVMTGKNSAAYVNNLVIDVVSGLPFYMDRTAMHASVYLLFHTTTPPSGYSGATKLAGIDTVNPSGFTTLDRASWIVDGISTPNLIKDGRQDLTTGFAIKGITRVGNSRKSRNVTILSGAYRRPIWEGKSDAEGKFFAPLYDYYDAVIPLIFDDYGYPLKKDATYVIGDVIHPSSPNGYRYICEQAGTSGTTLPSEPWSVEVLLTVGTAKFRPYPVYEPKCLGPIYPGKANLVTGEKV